MLMTDYFERFTEWNQDPLFAIELVETMRPRDEDRDVFALDWRNEQAVLAGLAFVRHIGLETTTAGMPIYDDGLVNTHRTHKGKMLFDFEKQYTTISGLPLFVVERRFVLPNEGMVAAISSFRASTVSLKSQIQKANLA